MSRDEHRRAVYSAEDQLRRLLDSGGLVDFHGSTLDVPAERKFGDLAGARRYLAALREADWGFPQTPPPRIVARRGPTRAAWHAPDVIRIPKDESWAMRETILLHEYAHHVAFHVHGDVHHDRHFCVILLGLLGNALSPAVELLLRANLTDAGVFPDPRA